MRECGIRRRLRALVAVVLLAACLCGIAVTARAEDAVSQNELEVLYLVNKTRMKYGLAPVAITGKLQAAADVRAVEIGKLFSHDRPNGSSCFTVLGEHQISYYTAGENIASGTGSPAVVMNLWMNSEGHRANILTAGYNYIGIGEKNGNWVQLFVGADDLGPAQDRR